MSVPLTDAQLADIRARCYAARLQPFSRYSEWLNHVTGLLDAIPVLLAEIERLKAAKTATSETVAAYSEAWIA